MTTATLSRPSHSIGRPVRDLAVVLVLLAVVGLAFVVGRVTHTTHVTRTVTHTVTRYAPGVPQQLGLDPCRLGQRFC